MNERLLLSVLSAKQTNPQDYKIGPDDVIEIVVFEEEKLNKTVRVSSQGNINLPLIGIVKAKGLTSTELEKEIRDLLASTYMYDPHVSVFIKEFHNQRISVMGAIQKPGVYDVTGQKTVLDVLALAGGLRDDAGRLLFLIRPPTREPENPKKPKGVEEKQPEILTADLEELLIKGDLRFNFPLSHGDVINIPPGGKVYVGGFVAKPGGFPLSRDMTLSQAIATAGGFEPKADGSGTRIFRYTGRGTEKEVLTYDVDAIHAGKLPDPYLKENDIVFVPKSGTKTVLIEIWDIIKGRIPGVPMR
jgi:polysaccharide export outer membrane protein